jgi:hypothetical protein
LNAPRRALIAREKDMIKDIPENLARDGAPQGRGHQGARHLRRAGDGSGRRDDRPALIFVQHGEIVEYASNCIEPIVHKAGDLRPEVYGTAHWWKNLGKETVILYVGDVRKGPNDHNM